LNGDLRETQIRILNDECHQSIVLKQSSVDSFIMAVDKYDIIDLLNLTNKKMEI
jgi:hypothetical protein